MPLEVTRYSLGAPPLVPILRGPRKGELRPRHEVVLPGWDDIIHVRPKSSLSEEEQERYLSRLFRSLDRSPTPDVSKNLARIAQQIDNVQDAAVTLSVVGRVIVKFTSRLNPIIGPITSVADLLNMVNILYPATLTKSGVGAVARTGAVLSGRKRYLLKRSIKRALGQASDGSLSTYLRRLQETLKTGKVGFGFGEALQILQTSDEISGVGLSLGPIFGGLQDSFWGFLRGARFDISGPLGATLRGYSDEQLAAMQKFAPGAYDALRQVDPTKERRIQIDFPGVFPQIDRFYGRAPGEFERDLAIVFEPIIEPNVRGYARTAATWQNLYRSVGKAAVSVWDSNKWLIGLRHDLPWDIHAELLVYQHLALTALKPFLQQTEWGEIARPIAESPAPADVLPFVGSTAGKTNGEVSSDLRTRFAGSRFDWVDEAPAGEARDFCIALVHSFAIELMQSLEGDSAAIEEDSGGWFKALWLMHEYNLLPPYERAASEVVQYAESVFRLMGSSLGSLPPFAEVLRAYQDCFPGVELES